MEMKTINFNDLKKAFNEDEWDISYISSEMLRELSAKPIKKKFHKDSFDITEPENNIFFNGIVLAKYCTHGSDYSLNEESEEILKKYFADRNFSRIYLDFKNAATYSGMGWRAKNSLIYNRKFGFQCKLCAYMFEDEILDYEKINPNNEILDLCNGCNDCIKNCPANAIHEDWIDFKSCYDFIGWGNHETIPSIKWYWYEKMKPDIPREVLEEWTTEEDASNFIWGRGVDGYYEHDGMHLRRDGQILKEVFHCRECQNQPKCSKAPYFT